MFIIIQEVHSTPQNTFSSMRTKEQPSSRSFLGSVYPFDIPDNSCGCRRGSIDSKFMIVNSWVNRVSGGIRNCNSAYKSLSLLTSLQPRAEAAAATLSYSNVIDLFRLLLWNSGGTLNLTISPITEDDDVFFLFYSFSLSP